MKTTGYYASIAGDPIDVTASYSGYPVTTLNNSGSYMIPTNYASHPMNLMSTASKILWVGAHPDDEIHASLLLGEVCHQSGTTCSFAVATNAGNPTRAGQMQDSVRFFGSTPATDLKQESYPDGSAATIAGVQANMPATLAWLKGVITSINPDYIISLDPRHTNYGCHADHGAISKFLITAVSDLSFSTSNVYLATQYARQSPGSHDEILLENLAPGTSGSWKHWAYSGDSATPHPDTLSFGHVDYAWDHLVELFANIHAGQFTPTQEDHILPLHITGGSWVGNDSSGRVQTFERLSDYSFGESGFGLCSGIH